MNIVYRRKIKNRKTKKKQKTIAIHILPNISRSKANQTMTLSINGI